MNPNVSSSNDSTNQLGHLFDGRSESILMGLWMSSKEDAVSRIIINDHLDCDQLLISCVRIIWLTIMPNFEPTLRRCMDREQRGLLCLTRCTRDQVS